MVRDLIVDMNEHDLLTEDKSNAATPVFDTVWGNLFASDEETEVLICNVVITKEYQNYLAFSDNELTIQFKSSYVPQASNFRLRLVVLSNGEYSLASCERNAYGVPASSYVFSKNIASPINACQLPFIDIDGEFAARIVQNTKSENLDRCYVYSSKQTDITIDYCDDQNSQLLSLCAPGKSYRYPTAGVGITSYLNKVISHSDLISNLQTQFASDSRPIQDASFDTDTGDLSVLASPEQADDDEDLGDVSISFFTLFTDDYVRRNIVIDTVANNDFISLMNDYENAMGIYFFTDSTTTAIRIADTVEAKQFDVYGNELASTQYFLVSATMEAGTIIMFDDEQEDSIKGLPVFTINDTDESLLYASLIEQPYWLTETCHRCFILLKRAKVKYMIKQSQFRNGKGLYTVPQTSANLKNMLGLVQDVHTGRLLAVVTTSTNISDISLDEITQHIYATHINE